MELIEAEISGYRRFAAKSEMDLRADLICVVGPNGAGKSSFLDGLVRCNDNGEFNQEERTRAEGGGVSAPSLRIAFELSAEDHEALQAVPEAGDARTFEVFKDDGRDLSYRVNPTPQRDLASRMKINDLLAALAKSPWLARTEGAEEVAVTEPEITLTSQLLNEAQEVTGASENNLDDERLNILRSLSARIQAVLSGEHLEGIEEPPKKFHRVPGDLDVLVEIESATPPHNRAIDVLAMRVPRFAKFSDEARSLRASYDLAGEPDEAIRNLLVLAGTTWEAAVAVATNDDEGRQTVFLDDTRAQLQKRLSEAWSQIPLSVRFHLNGTVLTVLMEMQANDLIKIDQQSDGLRQFVALRAFVAQVASDISPIILIDEAESHLHYDAQADLVAVLEAQTEAAKVIYTTHSAGCLPRDLGVGVRAIVPMEVEDAGVAVPTDHSRVINGFWFDTHGFSPILIAMGASAFAFASVQKAMITEGFTDAFLLPSLIREATGSERLEYQVVPRFASASADDIGDFDLVAPRFVCVADGDQGGREHAQFLERNGVAKEQIFYHGGSDDSGLSLEDLVDPETYLVVIKHHLAQFKKGLEFPPGDLPAKGRSNAVREWSEGQTGDNGEPVKLPKPALVQGVLNLRRHRPLLDSSQKDGLIELDAAVREFLSRSMNS